MENRLTSYITQISEESEKRLQTVAKGQNNLLSSDVFLATTCDCCLKINYFVRVIASTAYITEWSAAGTCQKTHAKFTCDIVSQPLTYIRISDNQLKITVKNF